MVSQSLLQELKAILEKKHGRTFTSQELEDYAKRWTEYFELARRVSLAKPIKLSAPVMVYFKKIASIDELKELYGKSSNTCQSIEQGTGR
ncbi:MAG: hypothetical protein M1383_02195 [Patescibacteria group bacterium]|nr:hypothetical protein [Patescibacteria group bacterium]